MTAETLIITTVDGRTVYSVRLPDGTLMESERVEDLLWFATLVTEAPYFVTGPTE